MSRELGKFSRPEDNTVERPPPTNIRYFYASSTSIDDPQTPVPPPVAAPSAAPKLPLRPFSEYDSTSLDRAWNQLRRNLNKYREEKEAADLKAAKAAAGRSPSLRGQPGNARSRGNSLDGTRDQRRSLGTWPAASASRDTSSRRGSGSGTETSRQHTPLVPSRLRDAAEYDDSDVPEHGLTGMPFIRAPSRSKLSVSHRRDASGHELGLSEESEASSTEQAKPLESPTRTLPVGHSRLHEVTMPDLQMRPIYWHPVNDIAAVVRGTWFFKDTMSPVEVEVANMLEQGFLDLRPWTRTWQDELNSACEVGAIGEEKIVHPLWPEQSTTKPPDSSRPSTSMSSTGPLEQEDTPETRRKSILDEAATVIEVSTSGLDVDNKAGGSTALMEDKNKRLFQGSQILYINEREAYILRPALAPSAYYGRRPLANYIKKDRSIGIPVVRGFDQKLWTKLNPPKAYQSTDSTLPTLSPNTSRPRLSTLFSDPSISKTSNGQVTDLVLVIHGIGQKLSERVESYHFTHAMNAFRREVNVEMLSNSVKPHLRKDMGGLMILPVNWRSSLSFDDGGYKDGPDDPAQNQYTLKDITPESLPSVRSIISDVMLDIPYYLSHHQPKMIKAVITEANRIFRLWCQHNPGFEKYGKVHIIAHSLGSVMALDILSRQPTEIDPVLPPEEDTKHEHFIFDTKNLFVCGSPAGFFLLLKKANLMPRKDRRKPPSDGDDWAPGVAGHQHDYGCLAIDNIYNIVNPYDPVAYRLNAALDASYAASLKPAFVPSAAGSWFAFSNPFKYGSSTISSTNRPSLTNRLPSNVELETHNFTREEIAEKRAFLLNDNGQIDYFLKYGGGPLEIQYLTMLGAHSSYWTSRDFVRFVVLETGRKQGRNGTLQAMRAVKKKAYAT